MATKQASKTSKTSTKTSKYDTVKDDRSESSATLVWSLMTAEADYQTRVAVQGPILAKRVADGEKQADIARELVAIAKANGNRLSQNTAAQRVSRYVRIGEKIIAAPAKADMAEVISKASASVRSGGKGKGKQTRRTVEERIAAWAEEGLALLRKAETQAQVEAMDTAATTLVEALAEAYALVAQADAVTDAA